jgi:hypothetical protein
VLGSFIFSLSALADAAIESQPSQQAKHGRISMARAGSTSGCIRPTPNQVDLLLFDEADATAPAHVVPMQRQDSDWRIKIRGPEVGQDLAYTYQAKEPREISPDDWFGPLFNESHVVGDP